MFNQPLPFPYHINFLHFFNKRSTDGLADDELRLGCGPEKGGFKIVKPKVILFSLICLVVFACVSSGRKIDQSAADKIEKGKTTRDQVVNLIGSPDRVTRLGNGDTIFTYHYTRATAKPATFIPIFGPLVGGANVQHQMYMVTFNSDGVVKNFFSSYGGSEVDQGLTTGGKPEMSDVEVGKRPK